MATNGVIHPFSEEALFDDVGPAYETAFAGLSPQIASIEWLKSELKDHSPAKVLDLGCGTGKPVCFELANAGHHVTGIDISGAMVADAQRKVPKAKFIKMEIGQYDPGSTKFDAITAYFSLMGGISQENIREYIKKIYSWLKPGGIFVYATLPEEGSHIDTTWLGRRVVYSSFDIDDNMKLIRSTGFEILHHDITTFRPKAVEAGLWHTNDAEETHLFIYAKK